MRRCIASSRSPSLAASSRALSSILSSPSSPSSPSSSLPLSVLASSPAGSIVSANGSFVAAAGSIPPAANNRPAPARHASSVSRRHCRQPLASPSAVPWPHSLGLGRMKTTDIITSSTSSRTFASAATPAAAITLSQSPHSQPPSISSPSPPASSALLELIDRARGLDVEKFAQRHLIHSLQQWRAFCQRTKAQSNPYSLDESVLEQAAIRIGAIKNLNEWQIAHQTNKHLDSLTQEAYFRLSELTKSVSPWSPASPDNARLAAAVVADMVKNTFQEGLEQETNHDLNSLFVNECFKTRRAHPLILSIVFMSVMKRLGVDTYSFPLSASTYLVGVAPSPLPATLAKEDIASNLVCFVDVRKAAFLSPAQFEDRLRLEDPQKSPRIPMDTLTTLETLLWKLFRCCDYSVVSDEQFTQIVDYSLVLLDLKLSSPPAASALSAEEREFYKSIMCTLKYANAKVHMKLMATTYGSLEGGGLPARVTARINLQEHAVPVSISSPASDNAASDNASQYAGSKILRKIVGPVPQVNLYHALKALSFLEDAWAISAAMPTLRARIQDLYSKCYDVKREEEARRMKTLLVKRLV